MPTNYEPTIRENRNLLLDGPTRDYYEVLSRVTRGSLWAPGRLRDIARLNLGLLPLPSAALYRETLVPKFIGNASGGTGSGEVQVLARKDKRILDWMMVPVWQSIAVDLPQPLSLTTFSLWLDASADYRFSWIDAEGRPHVIAQVGRVGQPTESYRLDVRLPVATPPFSRMLIESRSERGTARAGDLRFNDLR